MDRRSAAEPGPLEAAMRVIGVLRDELGVAWTDLALAPDGMLATFALHEAAAVRLRIRRRELLIHHVDRIALQRTERIECRRLQMQDAFARASIVRAWGELVREHVAAARSVVVADG
jgi:hypothetical protein